MGRPRKDPRDRLTRTITARVSDEQFDWLIDGMADGEFSASVRDAIDSARALESILLSRTRSPPCGNSSEAAKQNSSRLTTERAEQEIHLPRGNEQFSNEPSSVSRR